MVVPNAEGKKSISSEVFVLLAFCHSKDADEAFFFCFILNSLVVSKLVVKIK